MLDMTSETETVAVLSNKYLRRAVHIVSINAMHISAFFTNTTYGYNNVNHLLCIPMKSRHTIYID